MNDTSTAPSWLNGGAILAGAGILVAIAIAYHNRAARRREVRASLAREVRDNITMVLAQHACHPWFALFLKSQPLPCFERDQVELTPEEESRFTYYRAAVTKFSMRAYAATGTSIQALPRREVSVLAGHYAAFETLSQLPESGWTSHEVILFFRATRDVIRGFDAIGTLARAMGDSKMAVEVGSTMDLVLRDLRPLVFR